MGCEVNFITGRAGSGKSAFLREQIKACLDAGGRPALVVPEQFTFEAERELSGRLGGGLMGVEVYSFTTLARRVMDGQKVFISRQGRRMMVRKAVEDCQQELSIFAGSSMRPGFSEKLDDILSLCKRCAITPEALKKAADRLEPDSALAQKLRDISLIYARTEAIQQGRYISAEDALEALRARIPQSFLAGADVFIDCCDLWAQQIYGILEALMRHARSLTIALRADISPDCRDAAAFAPELSNYQRLSRMAREMGCTINTVRLPQDWPDAPLRHERGSAIWIAEHEVFAHPYRRFDIAPENIYLFAARDRESEAEAVADAIRRAAMRGIRYRDMAVVACDLPAYAQIVQRVFKRRGIPYFTDATSPLENYPLPRLLTAALKAITNSFRAEDVLSVLKSGLTDVDEDSAELFENYVLEYGIRGTGFLQEFTRGEVPPEAEAARQTLIPPLEALRSGLSAEQTAAGKAKALYAYMDALHVYDKIQALCESLRQEGLHGLADEHAQVYAAVIEVMEQLYLILSDSRVGNSRFLALLEEGFSAYSIGSIPTTLDQVLFGSVDRTKAREIKALFLIGAIEGAFPMAGADDGVIDDRELSVMASLGLNAWNSSAQNSAVAVYDAYNVIAKPSEYLYISYPLRTEDETVPSAVIDRLTSVFTGLRVHSALDADPSAPPADAESGLRMLSERLRAFADTHQPPDAALYAWYANHPEYSKRLERIQSVIFHDNSPAPFPPQLVEALYGNKPGSATQLETFNSCPFKHFARFGLKAAPRREYRERPTDDGQFCHDALSEFMQRIITQDFDMRRLTREQVNALMDDVLKPLIATHNGGIFLDSARMRMACARLCERLKAAAWALTRQFASGSFRVAGCEVTFAPNGDFPPLSLELPNGSRYVITGRIDRLDSLITHNPDGEVVRYYRVVDYKLGGENGFRFGDLESGIRLQLPLYIAAILSAERTAKCAGMYYQPLPDKAIDELEKDFEKALVSQFKLEGLTLEALHIKRASGEAIHAKSGLVEEHALEAVIGFAVRKAAATAQAIKDGHAEVLPSRSRDQDTCEYCEYGSICQFDKRHHRYRRVEKLDVKEFIERTQTPCASQNSSRTQ